MGRQDSGAAITVSAQNAQLPGVSDRVVRITGTQSQLMRALALILSKLLESPNYARLASVPVSQRESESADALLDGRESNAKSVLFTRRQLHRLERCGLVWVSRLSKQDRRWCCRRFVEYTLL